MSKRKRRQAITPEEMERVYQRCLKRERDRERKWRHTEQGEFESSFVSFDQMVDESDDPSKLPWAAQGLGGVITGIDDLPLNLSDRHKLKMAYQKLRRAGKGYLVRTLQLIARNGKNRKESIWQMMLDMTRQNATTTTTGRSWRHSSASNCGRMRKDRRQNDDTRKEG